MREVKIEEYWPLIVKRTEEFGQIAVAENPEFNELSRCVYQALKDSFLLPGEEEHAGEYAVSRWERMLGLGYTPDMSLDDRKAAILTYLSVKLPYTWRVLKQMLVGLLGEGNFEMSLDNETQKITIALALTTTQSQIAAVKQLIERVVPQNLEFELEWVDGMPMTYIRLEFLENTGTQWIDTGLLFATGNVKTRTSSISYASQNKITGNLPHEYFGENDVDKGKFFAAYQETTTTFTVTITGISNRYFHNKVPNVADVIIDTENGFVEVNGSRKSCTPFTFEQTAATLPIFAQKVWYSKTDIRVQRARTGVRIHSFEVEAKANGIVQHGNFIPALDPTGCPCLFDTVTFEPYYNKGTGQFLYPTDTAPAVSADLDERFYAKRTEHGIRRLYHVPKGYTGTKDQYAAEHGFKELVEPPMPLEGYWTPEWRETDTQLILEWVETEPPTEVTEK